MLVGGSHWWGYWKAAPATPRPAIQTMNGSNLGRPTLWVLAIGVSRYADPSLALRFAAADATAVTEALSHQQDGPLYREVRTQLLLDDAVTRASILRGLNNFMGTAAPVDIGVLYMAGHGVRDRSAGRYYFLPAAASVETPRIEGLDMDDFNHELRLLHRNLRRLVVILDTCHAGAAVPGSETRFGEDLAARLPPDEGLYVLAGAKSGEWSHESSTIGHGVFTKALLDGLQGGAADGDGLIRVLSLASYVSRLVPQLTNKTQTPYLSIIGEDLPFAAQPDKFAQVTPPPLPTPAPVAAPAPRRERIAIMNFENLRPDPQNDWMQQALGEQFATALHQVQGFDVYDERMVRFLAHGATDAIEASQRADMTKLVNGAYWVQNDRISITAHVKNTSPLRPLASVEVEGPVAQLTELSGRMVVRLLEQLQIELTRAELERLVRQSASDLAARKRLFDAERPPEAAPSASEPHAGVEPFVLGRFELARTSYAAENPNPDTELRVTLEGYRTAFERADIEALARYYAEFSPAQRAALRRYFDNADNLRVDFSDVQIAIIGDRAAVSFNREDHFIDHQTGEAQQVVVRVTKLFAKKAAGWQIVPEQ